MPDWLTIAGFITLAALVLGVVIAVGLWSYYGHCKEQAEAQVRAQIDRLQRGRARRARREALGLPAAASVSTPGAAAGPKTSVIRTPVLGHLDGDVTTDVTADAEEPGVPAGDTAGHRALIT